jgi:DNA-binding NarL/FixJ family response regulator
MNAPTNELAARCGAAVIRRSRVIIVDDHQLIRGGLRRAFEAAADFEVIGEADRFSDALHLHERLRPDVLVTDIRLPDGDGISLTARIRAESPSVGIVVLTMYAGDRYLFSALNAGASGFVGKDAPADDVVAAARHAAACPQTFTASDLAGALERRRGGSTDPTLSAREGEVLPLFVDGLGIAQIARRLYISEATVKTHVHNIYRKLNVGTRVEMVMAAVRLDLIPAVMSVEPRDQRGRAG